jgi:hypothetical protein
MILLTMIGQPSLQLGLMPLVVHYGGVSAFMRFPTSLNIGNSPALLNQLLAPTASEVASTTNRPVAQRNLMLGGDYVCCERKLT